MNKFNIGKTLVAAGLLSVAVNAQAFIMDGTDSSNDFAGELFAGVVDREAEISYNVDLGILYSDLIIPGKSWTIDLNQDPNFAQFIGKSGLEFNAFAATAKGELQGIGTSNEGLQPVIDWLVVPPTQGVFAIQDAALKYNSKTASLKDGAENLSSVCEIGAACYHDAGSLGPNLGGIIPFDTDGEGPLMLWRGEQNGRQGTATAIGSIDLNDGIMTVQTTVVPVPAAVWMFGSALLGLIGVRRRKA